MTQKDAMLSKGQEEANAFTRAQGRRQSLSEVITALELVATGPASGADWQQQMNDALEDVGHALWNHIEEVEGPDGLLAEIRDVAPRLAPDIATIETEHVTLMQRWHATRHTSREGEAIDRVDPERLQRRVSTLLGRLALHRERGADLVFDAYNVDIAASD